MLKAYELVTEAYRSKFRNGQKLSNQRFGEFAQYKEQLFDRWCLAMQISNDFGKLRELVLLEEFKQSVSPEISRCSKEKGVIELGSASAAADDYTHTNTHMVHFKIRGRWKQEPPKVNLILVTVQDILVIKQEEL